MIGVRRARCGLIADCLSAWNGGGRCAAVPAYADRAGSAALACRSRAVVLGRRSGCPAAAGVVGSPTMATADEAAAAKATLPRGWGRFGKAIDRIVETAAPDESLL